MASIISRSTLKKASTVEKPSITMVINPLLRKMLNAASMASM
jgi:hypothetical protein